MDRINNLTSIYLFVFSEVQEMGNTLPSTCKVDFEDPNVLYKFHLVISPEDGHWVGGSYKFLINVPLDYNNVVSFSDTRLTIINYTVLNIKPQAFLPEYRCTISIK